MHYYEVVILKQNAPLLTYSSQDKIKPYYLVDVLVRGRLKTAMVLKEVKKPSFKTIKIENIKDEYYSKESIEFAKFISKYYFSTFSEAISLFLPQKDIDKNKIEALEFDLPKLSSYQQEAFDKINNLSQSLLFGVTGSGKTEIYIHLIAKVLEKKQSAIILMPEIALTPQITKRVTKYFGDLVAIWHSKLTKKKRLETLKKIQQGEIRVAIGARSALFLPIQNLGIIVVDEEHDDSYKAMSNPRYNAKDLAVYLAKVLSIKVVLGSATPLVSSYKKYSVVRLNQTFIKTNKRFEFISGEEINSAIMSTISKHTSQGEQVLIFVPTRANFKYLICNSCGKAITCPYCSIGMSVHSKRRVLQCHYCNFTDKIASKCPHCQDESLITKRVGTSEVKALIEESIKDAKVEVFDKDNITTANKLEKAIKRINSGEVNVVIGTQMLSKGHDYANITLSVILGLDFITAIGDYRAKERAIALMHQIAGRSGRAKDATILIQTSQPDFFKPYLDNYEDFIKEELNFRNPIYPPFANLARVLISNKDYKKANDRMQEALLILQENQDIEIVGYGIAPIEKIANKWRFNILLRANKKTALLNALIKVKNIENIDIDMDPVEFA